MKQPLAPVTADLLPFLESGVSILVGTRDEGFRPDCARAVGARIDPGGREATVFLPDEPAADTLANLAANGRVAVCFSRICDHRSVQLKGRVLRVQAAGPRDRAVIQRYRDAWMAALADVGMSPSVIARVRNEPCHAVRFRIESVFEQTPGPGAGEPLAPPARPESR